MDTVTVVDLFKAAILDSLNAMVLVLFIGGLLFWVFSSSWRIHLYFPIFCSGILTLGTLYLLPYGAIPISFFFFFGLWGVTLPFLAYCEWEDRKLSLSPEVRSLNRMIHGLVLFAFLLLSGMAIVRSEELGIAWQGINTYSFITFVFFLFYRIAPWYLIPEPAYKFPGKTVFYCGIGLFLLHLCMWGYTGFHAVFDEGSGSFRMKGKTFALDYSQHWQFSRLENLILQHWYYPTPIERKSEDSVSLKLRYPLASKQALVCHFPLIIEHSRVFQRAQVKKETLIRML